MSWTPLSPIIRTVPNAKASISVTKSGAKILLSFSDAFYQAMKRPKRVDLSAGAAENAGKVLVRANEKSGAFDVLQLTKGGARLSLPVFAGVPDGARDAEPCTTELTGDTVIVTLPLRVWEAQLAPAKSAVNSTPAKSAVNPPPSAQNATKVRAINYLESKGHEVARTRNGFVLDGAAVDFDHLLGKINQYRKKADLPPVAPEQIILT